MTSALKWAMVVLAFWSPRMFAQPVIPLLQPPLQQTTPDGFRAHLQSLRGLVDACRNDAKACDQKAVGDDEKVEAPGGTFQVRWQWLRELMEDARNPALPDRASLLDQASARLNQELAEAGSGVAQPIFAVARRAANAILARPEFRVVSSESWLDRETAKFWVWVYRIFSAASNFGHHAPWLSRVLEWGFVGIAGLLALIWVARTLQRERLAVSLGGMIPAAEWQKESDKWAELARAEAEKQNWREAIHCLYWASIVVLESRRLWRRDATRTPREYVELLERDSPQQLALRSITRLFERIWYGLREGAQEDYVEALASFEDLRRI